MGDLLVKYKELEGLVNFLTDLASQTSLVIDKTLHNQGETIPVDLLTNYTAYMGALNLMVVQSSAIWMQRKMLKAISDKKPDDRANAWDKMKAAVLNYNNAAESLIKPLEYFSKLYNPKAQKEKGDKVDKKVASLEDIVNIYTAQLEKLQKHYVKTISSDDASFKSSASDTVKAGLISGGIELDRDGILFTSGDLARSGGSEIWVGGLQTQTLMTSHLAKHELLRNEADELVSEQLDKMYNTDQLSLKQIAEKAELSKPVALLEWDKLEDSIREYLKHHAAKYNTSVPDSDLVIGGCDYSLFEELETLDRNILLRMMYDEFTKMNEIENMDEMLERLDELKKNIETIKEHPNKRTEILSEMRYLYEEIKSLETKLDEIGLADAKPIVGTNAKERLSSIVAIEQEFLPKLQEMETLWLDIGKSMSSLKQLWLTLVDSDNKSTCIMWTGLLLTSLLRLDLIAAIGERRFPDKKIITDNLTISDEYPRISLYENGISRAKLEEFVQRFI
jgi:hypothetical protein